MIIFDAAQLIIQSTVVPPPAPAAGLPALASISAGDLIGITINSLSIDTSGYIDSGTDIQDTIVLVNIGGQSTPFALHGGGVVTLDAKYKDKVLYLGAAKSSLDFEMKVTQSRQGIRDALSTAGKDSATVASFIPSTLPAPIAPAISLFAEFLSFISKQIQDDLEATVFRQLKNVGINSGTTVQLKINKGVGGTQIVSVDITINKINATALPSGKNRKYAVAIKNPLFNFTASLQTTIQRSALISVPYNSKHPYTYSAPKTTPAYTLLTSLDHFSFEATSGTATKAYAADLDGGAIPRLNWDYLSLFEISVSQFDTIPLALSLSLTSKGDVDQSNMSDYTTLLTKGGSLATALGTPTADINVITKSAPSVLNFISELSQDSLSLYSFNGALLLLSPGSASPQIAGQIPLSWDAANNLWSAQILQVVNWPGASSSLGTLTFTIEVTAVL